MVNYEIEFKHDEKSLKLEKEFIEQYGLNAKNK